MRRPTTLAPGASATLTKTATVNGTVTNTGTATGTFDDPDSTSATATASATVTGEPCGEGCTPGFWKTHTDLWDAGSADLAPNYDPGDDFYAAFGITIVDGGTLPNILTLEDALNLGGGGIFALARHAAAALINSDSSIGYPYTTAQVIDIFRDGINASTAIPPDNYTLAQALAALSTANELGCPF